MRFVFPLSSINRDSREGMFTNVNFCDIKEITQSCMATALESSYRWTTPLLFCSAAMAIPVLWYAIQNDDERCIYCNGNDSITYISAPEENTSISMSSSSLSSQWWSSSPPLPIAYKSSVYGALSAFCKIFRTICLAVVGCGWPILWDKLCFQWGWPMFLLFQKTFCL